ncbi:MAG: GNAT family N-acetyltransferase [Chloroflexota bacterium]
MIDIRPLTQLNPDDFRGIVTGYTSSSRYRVQKSETDQSTVFALELEQMDTPYVKHDDLFDEDNLRNYQTYVQNGFSFGAYDGERLIGIAVAEAQEWSNRLWLWEFHIAEAYRGMGVGRRLMDTLIERSRQAGLRAIFLETQNTNVGAIRFYRKMGFTLAGLNLALYSNQDYPDGEICLFMMRNLQD